MTLKQLIKEELDTTTIQNNISNLKKIKEKLPENEQQQIDAVISGLEAEQKEKKTQAFKYAQVSGVSQTAQPQGSGQTAQIGA
jgi:hypothetical protein